MKEIELTQLRAENAELRRTTERQRRVLGDVERVLGEYFAGLDPKILEHPDLYDITAPFRIPRMRRATIMDDQSAHDSAIAVGAAIQAIELLPLIMEEPLEVLRDAVHVRTELAGQSVHYRISAAALEHMPLPLLVNNIAEVIAWQLMAQLRRDSHD